MMNIEKVLKNERLMHALTGMSAHEFMNLLPEFTKVWQRERLREYQANLKRERKPGGGRKGCTGTIAEKFLFILLYYKCYPTYDLLGFLYDCNRSNACRKQQKLSIILEATLKRKLVLPKRQIRNIEEFFRAFPEAKEVFIDGTERPIQRPQNTQKQKANYSGKKKRHTRKNIIISTRHKRIGFLSKTVEGKEADITILRANAPRGLFPKTSRLMLILDLRDLRPSIPTIAYPFPTRNPAPVT